jgi:hypothetical protein
MKKLLLSAFSALTIFTVFGQITSTSNVICNGDDVTLTAPSTNILTSTLGGGNNHRGNMFEVVATNDIIINSFDAHPMGNTTIAIYYKTGSYIGFEANASAWTLVGTAAVTAQPFGTPTPVPVPVNLTIMSGQAYSFYVTSTNTSVSLNYTDGTSEGAVYVSDANLQFKQGKGMEYPFTNGGGTFSPRIWNGRIHYTPVSGTNILWSTGATTASITVSPSSTTTYSVAVNSPSYTDSIEITVNPTYSIALSSSICAGDSILLGGQYQSIAGTYLDSLSSINGCDSIINTTLSINPVYNINSNASICAGDSIFLEGAYQSAAGIYTDNYISVSGCDSTVIINLSINSTDTSVTPISSISLSANASSASYQWINCSTMQTISGATNQVFVATANGTYAVIVTENNCSDTSSCYTISGVGINETSINKNTATVYPNPSTGELYIMLPKLNTQTHIKIFDLYGKEVVSFNSIQANPIQLSLSELSKGLYIINIQNQEVNQNVKVVLK